MLLPDLINVFQWWIVLFFIGVIFTPITNLIFPNFIDRGYIFAKVIGIAFISYAVFVLGFLKILPFTEISIIVVGFVFLIFNIFLISKYFQKITSEEPIQSPRRWVHELLRGGRWKIFFFEEILFFGVLFFWSFIHAHAPDIHGLEKYMDYGFINSILRTEYFPPKDMWFTPLPINYYYFGHLVTAVLTKLSNISPSVTFNLMLSTISALSFVSAFSIGANLMSMFTSEEPIRSPRMWIICGFLTAFILNFAGNFHTIYSFFKPYANENPVPFWQLVFSPITFPNGYWYPNATRFIENTIHEFPLYSYVVSDLHGHVLDIPFVLLTITVLLSLLLSLKIENLKFKIPLISFLLAVMYMTNAWDGIIYFLLTALIVLYIIFRPKGYPVLKEIKNEKLKIKNSFQIENFKLKIRSWIIYLIILGAGLFIFSLPFNFNFKPFASGIGILCAPKFLTDIGNFGPFLFESDHCQRSPLWQLGILYGFFYFFVFSFIISLLKNYKLSHLGFINNLKLKIENLSASDIFILLLIFLSTLLIIVPEFIYVKDIYPEHYRANTMFKLVYQSFIMLSLSCGYITVRLFLNRKSLTINRSYWKFSYSFIGLLVVCIVFLYPYFAVNSYFGNLKTYSGLNGTKYLNALYSNDYEAILWINKNIKNQPVILEAQGDSYTDFGRVSTNTGLPTVLGWTVHEWLWRGTYDIPSPRIEEVKNLYETKDMNLAKRIIKKYAIRLIFIGNLEVQKYPNLNEQKFETLGNMIYKNGETRIYKINN